MTKNIIEHFPPLDGIDTYIEPFGGSFSIGLKVLDQFPNIIYNDLEKNVYTLFKVLSTKELYDEFKALCDLSYFDEHLRKELKNELRYNHSLNDVARAYYFFYVNRTSRNGIGGFSLNLVERRKMSKSVSDFLSAIDRLPELHHALSKCLVLNTNGIELVKKYDKPNVFFYLDPPYEQSTRTGARYVVDMARESQEEFLEILLNVKRAKFLLSGYDCELYEILEKNGINKLQFDVKTVGYKNNKKTKTETLWKNY